MCGATRAVYRDKGNGSRGNGKVLAFIFVFTLCFDKSGGWKLPW